MTLRIRIEHGQGAGKSWRFATEGTYVFGRVPQASVQILDMKVSKKHCSIVVKGQGAEAKTWLIDGGSTHGSLINGQPVSGRVALKPGDEIRIGLTILRVLSDGKADADAVPTGAAEEEKKTADKAAGTPVKKRLKFPPDALVNTEIGGYKVLEKIGQGGMGSVYTAEQLSLNREVAFKVLSEKFTSDSAFVDQFVNEARSAAALNHPNVVQVYDVGKENGRYYFSMEFVSGGSLEERIAVDGPAEWQDALNWMIDASNALIFAQKREILHRDVKPDNLMLAEDGSAKLCDLGLAKKAAHADMLAAGIIGTPAFIAPEAIRRRKDVDVRSDLYSLGCTFYRILTNKNPYPGKTVKEILLGHLKAPVPRVSGSEPNIPRELDDVIFRLMQKEPEERFATPQDLLQALDKIRVQHGLEAHGLRPASRKPLVIALIVVVLLGGAGLAYVLSQGNGTQFVEDPEAKAREAARLQEIERLEFDKFVGDADGELDELEKEFLAGNLYLGENWSKPAWPELAAKFKTLAGNLRSNGKYGSREEVVEVANGALEKMREINEYVDLRRTVDEDVKRATSTEGADLDAGLKKFRDAHDAALKAKAWVKAAVAAHPDAIAEFVKPYFEKTVQDVLPDTVPANTRKRFEGVRLLDPKEQIEPLLEKYVPGEPYGADLVAAAARGARGAHKKALSDARQLQGKKTHAAYDEAMTLLEAYVEGLGDVVDAKAGPLVEDVPKYEAEAESLLEALRTADQDLQWEDIEHDLFQYQLLVHALRNPKGLCFNFKLAEAKRTADVIAKGMRWPGYQVLAREISRDIQALVHLLDRLASTFPAGWVGDQVAWKDAKGRTQSERVRACTSAGITLDDKVFTFSALAPDWVLHRVFTTEEGEPRFALEGEDHRGLAVLAEMAVDFDVVEKHYRAYLAWLPADRIESHRTIGDRLSGLTLERQAAEAWKVATDNLRELDTFLDAHDPDIIGIEPFDKPALREELTGSCEELRELLEQARRATTTLKEDARYRATLWATAVRDPKRPISGVRYANEPERPKAPEAPPGDGPDKPAPGGDPEEPAPTDPDPDKEPDAGKEPDTEPDKEPAPGDG